MVELGARWVALLAGGAMLLWIAYKLLINPDNGDEHKVSSADNFWSAMRTIVIADRSGSTMSGRLRNFLMNEKM